MTGDRLDLATFLARPDQAVRSGHFGRNAARLTRLGFECIPITLITDQVACPGKQPAAGKGWQHGCPQEQWSRYARGGLGILTRNTPALDVDVLDPELAERIQGVADRVLGKAPYRIGRAPKRLMPFRLQGEPFKKMSVVWTLHDQPGAVELLGGR